MILTSNKQLSDTVRGLIDSTGTKLGYIAEKMGVSPQQLNNILNKKHFSIDDALPILSIIGYTIDINFVDRNMVRRI